MNDSLALFRGTFVFPKRRNICSNFIELEEIKKWQIQEINYLRHGKKLDYLVKKTSTVVS